MSPSRPVLRYLGWLLVGGALAVGATPGGSSVPFETIARGAYSRVSEPLRAVVRTPEEWAALWARHAGPTAPLPAVDFARSIVVAVFAGTRPTSGYAVEITGVHVADPQLDVTYRERTPPAGAILLPVVTRPFHVIRLPRSDLPVRVMPDPA